MKNLNSIEDQFKENFMDFEVPVPDRVKSGIDAELFSNKSTFWSKFRLIALFSILGIGALASYFVYTNSSTSPSKPTELSAKNETNLTSSTIQKKSNSSKLSDSEIDKSDVTINTENGEKSSSQSNAVNAKNRIIQEKQTTSKNSNASNVSDQLVKNPAKAIAQNNSSSQKEVANSPQNIRETTSTISQNQNVMSESFNSTLPKNSENQPIISTETTTSNSQTTVKELKENLRKETKVEEKIVLVEETKSAQNADTLVPQKSEKDTIQQTLALTENTNKTKVEKDKSVVPQWSLEANASAVFNWNKAPSGYTYSVSNPVNFGLLGSYNFSQKLGLGTGLQFQQQNENLFNSYQSIDSTFIGTSIQYIYGDSNEIIDSIVVVNFSYDTTTINWAQENRVQLFSIPLFVEMGFPFSKNWRFGLQTGVRFNFFLMTTFNSNGDLPLPKANSFGVDFLLRPKLGYQFKNIEIGGHIYTVLAIKSPEIWPNYSVTRNSFGTGVYLVWRF